MSGRMKIDKCNMLLNDILDMYAGKHCISIDFKNNGDVTLWIHTDVNIEEKKEEEK